MSLEDSMGLVLPTSFIVGLHALMSGLPFLIFSGLESRTQKSTNYGGLNQAPSCTYGIELSGTFGSLH